MRIIKFTESCSGLSFMDLDILLPYIQHYYYLDMMHM